MTNPVFVVACTNAFGDTVYAKFEQNPECNRILSLFAAESPLNAAHFLNERNAKYALDKTPSLMNGRVLKLTPTLEEVA